VRRACALAALALLAGCAAPAWERASTPEGAEASAAPAPGSQTYAEDLLAYLGRLRSLNESALGAEAARMKRDASDVAALLQAMAAERKRLRQRAAAAAGELREERRAMESQKQRAEALQHKLDALTDLEKSLANRDIAR
jgi:hypothetical protein